ncbi:Sodium leak channel non-selective protein [Chionoecetes opilio]|uniref:Sodium leak channel non-selective protein n=1 Tax=Chionoecetes opilio TaxID=41210 RepID=A0A8J4YFR3_CHIOP|nr:Sodium leak channel non-selective protein [Chionoecetes opilio]
MLGRKQSLRGDHILGDYGPEETLNESAEIEWANKRWIRWLLRICSLVSLVSVSANTPKSKELYPSLKYITFCSDLSITFFFTVEMVAKMQARGILRVSSNYYMLS